LDRRSWIFTRLLVVMLTATPTSFSAAVFIWASFEVNVRLRPVARFPTSANYCLWRCWNNYLTSLHFPGFTCWFSRSNDWIALCQTASHHMVGASRALLLCTGNFLHFDAVTFSDLYTWSCIAALILWIFCSHNWWDSHANCPSTLTFTDFDAFSSRIPPLVLYIASVHCAVLWGIH
jgi:hypothetical protein